MNLLYVSSDVSSIHINLLAALEKAGVDNVLCTYTTTRNAKEPIQAKKTWLYNSHSFFRGPVRYLSRLKDAARFFLSKIDTSTIDLMHGNMMFGDGYVCRFISQKTGIPYVLSVRNTDLNLWFLWKLPWIKKAGIDNLLKAQKIIFLSKPYKELLLSRIPSDIREAIERKCIIVPNGVDDFWFNNKRQNPYHSLEAVKFLTVGRIEKNKNQLAVAKAVDFFRTVKDCEVKYYIVGDCENEEMYKQLSDFDFVTIIPFQNKEELINRFRESDIYIMPSHTETFGLVYVEAMTQGLPVIYTEGQGFDEQFENGVVGYSVNSRDIKSIEKGIELSVNNYNVLSQQAYKNCERFTWESICEQLINNYKSSIKD